MRKGLTNGQKASLHIVANELGMIQWGDDAIYRDFLFSVCGKRSSTHMDQRDYTEVKNEMIKRGGVFKTYHKSARRSGMHTKKPKAREKLLSKIGAILADMGLPWSYADSIADQMYGDKSNDRVAKKHVRMLDYTQTHAVMVALIKHQRKKG